jgi:hypothetical protein
MLVSFAASVILPTHVARAVEGDTELYRTVCESTGCNMRVRGSCVTQVQYCATHHQSTR